jgi:dihydropyrimidinase
MVSSGSVRIEINQTYALKGCAANSKAKFITIFNGGVTMELIVKGGKIVSPTGTYSAAIGVDGGKIVAIGNEHSMPSAKKVVDAGGNYLLPGVCDMHCHEDFPGTEKAGFAPWSKISRTEPQAGALGGVTTQGFYLMPPGHQSLADAFDGYRTPWESNSVLDGVFHIMAVSEQRLDEMARDCSEFGITTFKFLIGYKGPQAAAQGLEAINDGFLVDGFERIVRLIEEGWPALALIHAENPDIIPYLKKKMGDRYDTRAWYDTRPNYIEEECVRRVIFLSGVAKCPILIVHTTIKEAVTYARKIKGEGVRIGEDVIIETCPQYLTQNHDNPIPLMKKKPVFTVVNPPIRSQDDNEALWQGIKDGLVTVMGSDTSPSTMKSKDVDMWKAPFVPMGISSNTGFILPVLLSEGVNKRGLSLEKVVEVTSYNPARYYGIYPQKGAISVGSDADMVIVDLNKELTWRHAEMSPSNADWNIYDGWKFKGWPQMTILRGKVIMEDNKIVAEPGYGKYIPRRKRQGYGAAR